MKLYTSDYVYCHDTITVTIVFASGKTVVIDNVFRHQTSDGCRIYDVQTENGVIRKIIPFSQVEQITEVEYQKEKED